MKKTRAAALFLILLSFAIGFYVYPTMPETMASHWDAQGQVNGYLPKFWGVFLLPIISAGMYLLFLVIPRIDPKRENIERFAPYFDRFGLLMVAFFLYLYLLTIVWSWGYSFDMNVAMLPALGVIFYYCGVLMEKAKPNWSIGIRTPWTLSSETVWNKTHARGAKLFKLSGLLAALGALAGAYAFWFVLVPILGNSLYLLLYSYQEFQKEKSQRV